MEGEGGCGEGGCSEGGCGCGGGDGRRVLRLT